MIKAIVTDIEGTTSSISFVHEVLFPYSRQHIGQFLREKEQLPAVAEQIVAVSEWVGKPLDLQQTIQQLIQWIDQDQKVTPLKALQGLLWEAGYENGDYEGHLYPDAYSKLCQWSEMGLQLYVYSSGSVKAQQLLFAHTPYGDLTRIFHGYFDTRIGGKREETSYQTIAAEIGLPAQQILFLSDIKEELDAATVAGMQVYWLKREGCFDDSGYRQVASFTEISLLP